jgi:hypothetical protein
VGSFGTYQAADVRRIACRMTMHMPRRVVHNPASAGVRANGMRRVVAGGVIVMGILLAASVAFRVDVARYVALRLIDRAGFGPADMQVTGLGLHGLQASDLRLAGGALQVAHVALRYTPSGLMTGRIDAAEIDTPDIRMALAGSDLLIGDRKLNLAGSSAGRVQFARLGISHAHVAVTTPQGLVEAEFSADIALAGPDVRGTGLGVNLAATVDGTRRTIRVDVPKIALASTETGTGLTVTFSEVGITPTDALHDTPFALSDLAGDVVWNDAALAAHVTGGQLRSTRVPESVVPLRITAHGTLAGAQLGFDAQLEAAGKATLRLAGVHDRVSGIGHVDVTLRPLVFQNGGLQPFVLFPAIGRSIPQIAGTVALSGAIAWRAGRLAPALVLHLADLAYQMGAARISKVAGDIHIISLTPPATMAGQALRGVIEVPGLVPMPMGLEFQLMPKPALRVERTSITYLGGRITTSPFTVDPVQTDVSTTVALDQINLAQFLALAGVESLSGSGALSGQIPLVVSHDTVEVRDGYLASTAPGVLRLGSATLPKAITESGADMTLLLQALADFHYDSLNVDLAGQPTGEATIGLHLKGANPAVLQGQAFNINLNLKSNFGQITNIVVNAFQAAQLFLRNSLGR